MRVQMVGQATKDETLLRGIQVLFYCYERGMYLDKVAEKMKIGAPAASFYAAAALLALWERYNLHHLGNPTMRAQRPNQGTLKPYLTILKKELQGEELTEEEKLLAYPPPPVEEEQPSSKDEGPKSLVDLPDFVPAAECDGVTLVRQAMLVLANLYHNMQAWIDKNEKL
jgi:hypothetical protein